MFFYSVVAVPCSAVPLTLKAAEFSVSALQSSQQCYILYVSTNIPTLFFIVFFLAAKSEGLRTFLSCELHEPVGQKETYLHCGVTLPSH